MGATKQQQKTNYDSTKDWTDVYGLMNKLMSGNKNDYQLEIIVNPIVTYSRMNDEYTSHR